MIRLILSRVAIAVGTILAVSVVVFFGVSALPGDTADAILGQRATPERVEVLREQYGLNEPLVKRYGEWLGGFVRGDLGTSLTTSTPVWDLIKDRLRNTLVLALCAIALLVPLAVVLGVLSALKRDSWLDHAVASSTLTFVSMPEFVLGAVLIAVFSFGLGVLPASSLVDSSRSLFAQSEVLVLPVLTLVGVAVAQATRMIRAAMIDVLHQDYIETAVLRGVPPRRIVFRHALPNAMDSTVQVLALTVGWLVGGVVVVETLFQFPGIGAAFVDAVSARDLPTVQALALVVTTAYVLANLLAEVIQILMNPKLRRRST